jgi:hypothetical protein
VLLPSNTSTNKLASPNNLEGDSSGLMVDTPTSAASFDWQKNFALVTSLLLCNKTTSNISVSAKIVNGTTSALILNGISLPPNTSYDVISGNKITLKEGDRLYVWHNNANVNSLDAVCSFTLHRPLTTYEI